MINRRVAANTLHTVDQGSLCSSLGREILTSSKVPEASWNSIAAEDQVTLIDCVGDFVLLP